MPPHAESGQRSVVLACTAIVYLIAALFSATFGAVQPGSEWVTQTAYGLAGLSLLYGMVRGGTILRRDLRRRQLIRGSGTRLHDMMNYLGGHPDLPRPARVLAVLTSGSLILDAGSARAVIPLLATRQARRAAGNSDGKERLWLVAHNSFSTRPADALDIEFLDAAGHPRRLTLAQFRRTSPAQWSAALAEAVGDVVNGAGDVGSVPRR